MTSLYFVLTFVLDIYTCTAPLSGANVYTKRNSFVFCIYISNCIYVNVEYLNLSQAFKEGELQETLLYFFVVNVFFVVISLIYFYKLKDKAICGRENFNSNNALK